MKAQIKPMRGKMFRLADEKGKTIAAGLTSQDKAAQWAKEHGYKVTGND